MSEKSESSLNDVMTASGENENIIHSIVDIAKGMEILSNNVRDSLKSLDSINHKTSRETKKF